LNSPGKVVTATDASYRGLSFWHDSVPGSLTPRAALQHDEQADIAIIGAGYTGLWTAYYLKQQQPSLRIILLESEIAGYGASGRNGGWCSAFLSNIERWFADPGHRAGAVRLQKLMFDTVREVGEVAQRESIDCHYEHSGALEVAVNPAHLQRLKAELASARDLGFGEDDFRPLTAAETTQRINIDGALGGLLISHCAAIHPARLARGLAVALEKMGVKIFEQSPVLSVDGRVVRTPHARVTAETVILATEGYSRDLPGLKRRLVPMHSMMVATEPLSPEQLHGIHFQQRFVFGNYDRMVTYGQVTADQRIAFGCRGMYRFGSAITHRFAAGDPCFDFIRNTLVRFFPALKGIAFTHAWGGSMGVSRRLSPSVNYDPRTGQAWAGGFFGNGVGATHLAGKTLADLVLRQDTERVHTPWVNPLDDRKKWEPEPLRWLGISAMAKLMHQVDRVEYATGRTPPLRNWILERLVS